MEKIPKGMIVFEIIEKEVRGVILSLCRKLVSVLFQNLTNEDPLT